VVEDSVSIIQLSGHRQSVPSKFMVAGATQVGGVTMTGLQWKVKALVEASTFDVNVVITSTLQGSVTVNTTIAISDDAAYRFTARHPPVSPAN
jgi:hypothetical protein